MNGKKVLVADASPEFCNALAEALKNTVMLTTCHDGVTAEALLRSLSPDVVVMDLAMQGMDGLTLLKRIAVLANRPKIVLTTCFISPYIERSIGGLGVEMVLVKPCHIRAVVDCILDLLEIDVEPSVASQGTSSVAAALIELGISPRRRGFRYLEKCIALYRDNPGRTLSNVIYPQVAEQCHTGVDGVERAMRQLIREAWNSRNEKVWRKYFGVGRQGMVPRPTNAEFIARLAEQEQMLRWEYA